jgi:cystathionine beta-lyase/cystathionine gamma-synthase
MLFVETPTNPLLALSDLRALGRLARQPRRAAAAAASSSRSTTPS